MCTYNPRKPPYMDDPFFPFFRNASELPTTTTKLLRIYTLIKRWIRRRKRKTTRAEEYTSAMKGRGTEPSGTKVQCEQTASGYIIHMTDSIIIMALYWPGAAPSLSQTYFWIPQKHLAHLFIVGESCILLTQESVRAYCTNTLSGMGSTVTSKPSRLCACDFDIRLADWTYACISRLSRNLFIILQNIPTVVGITCRGYSCECGIYVPLIII